MSVNMSRPSSSLLRSLAGSSSRQASASGAIRARKLHQSARTAQAPRATEISFIDPRILEGQAFLPKENVARITEWQAGLWSRLQAEVSSNPGLEETKAKWDKGKIDLPGLISDTATKADQSLAFNYASLLLNNSFFLERLSIGTRQAVPTDLQHLEEKVTAYADGIVGSAWLWLVRVGDAGSSESSASKASQIDIIPTFGAGSFIVAGRHQRGRDALPVAGQPASTSPAGSSRPFNQSTQAGMARTQRALASGAGAFPIPLAVLSLHEHAYLGSTYGVWGRKDYARDWYRSLDWNRVVST